jgi:ribosomal protein L21E
MPLTIIEARKTSRNRINTMAKKSAAQKKISKVMKEYGSGQLHAGGKKGPVVKSQKQAVAIALSEARRASKGKRRK